MEAVTISVSAAQISSLRCGGTLERVFVPSGEKSLDSLYNGYGGEKFTVLGGLTDTLVLSGGVKEPVILTEELRGLTVEGDLVKASAGERLSHIASVVRGYGLSGMESLSGIPGTIGGAVMGNAGCFGAEISDILSAVDIFRLDTGEREFLTRDEIAFNYRYSNLRASKDLITRVYLRLYQAPITRITAKMEAVRQKRTEQQPHYPSLGCVFKRCKDKSAGFYIEKAGLKGYRYGGMEISDRHANFIVNRGGTPEDYLYLVNICEKKVYETFGIKLEREVKIIGEQGDMR